jgi:tRNA-Thr(GGU) m(6)t(6)A37 methyltransferase TsaA
VSDPDATVLRPGEAVVPLPAADDAGLIFIGRIATPWTARAQCPRRGDPEVGPVCRLVLEPRWIPALEGLRPGSRALILYWMDRARRDLVRQSPGHRGTTGTFAIRSPNRPNPIAVSTVTVLAVEGAVVTVRGLDCLDGTPLLDIKPDTCPQAG